MQEGRRYEILSVPSLFEKIMEKSVENLLENTVDVITREAFVGHLQNKRPMRIKVGFDPTRPDLHLGHLVLLKKMRQFQDLGHTVILIVGDFTAMIGDPSGKNVMRPKLTRAEILDSAKTYTQQAFIVLDPERTEIHFNSEWLSNLDMEEVFRIFSQITIDQLLARHDFRQRLDDEQGIFLHEIIYPILQGYDSVAINADIELGGTDQLFNLLVGRQMMAMRGLVPQIVMTMPLLVGTDAHWEDGKIIGPKMSKSLDNYIGLTEDSETIRQKILNLEEPIACEYTRLLSSDPDLIAACSSGDKSSNIRTRLADELISYLHKGGRCH